MSLFSDEEAVGWESTLYGEEKVVGRINDSIGVGGVIKRKGIVRI